MKKIAITFVCCLISFLAQAQTEHLKFMGIPLNGTISQFQAKLQQKGVQYDAIGSKKLKLSCRLFNGKFTGEDADFYVYYNTKTKIVYRSKAVISYYGLETVKSKLEHYKSLLREKYGVVGLEDSQNGYPSFTLFVSSSEGILGWISLYITENDFSYNEYALHIDYEDSKNTDANEKKDMDDL